MVNLPSLRHLRYLMALDDHRHFGRAAEACHVTQSTLSASIKELEGVLEAAVVDRSKTRVVLTPVGIETVERARRIIKEVGELVQFTIASREPLYAGLLLGTSVVTRPLLADEPARKIGLVWRRGTGRRNEFRLVAKELAERAKPKSEPTVK